MSISTPAPPPQSNRGGWPKSYSRVKAQTEKDEIDEHMDKQLALYCTPRQQNVPVHQSQHITRAASPLQLVTRALPPSELVTRALPPSQLVTRALPPSQLVTRALPPSELVTRALPPSQLVTRALPPSQLVTRALPPSQLVTRTLPRPHVIIRAYTTSENTTRSALPPQLVTRSTLPQLVKRPALPPQLVTRSALPPQLVTRSALPPQLVTRSALPPQLVTRSALPPQLVTRTASSQLAMTAASQPQLVTTAFPQVRSTQQPSQLRIVKKRNAPQNRELPKPSGQEELAKQQLYAELLALFLKEKRQQPDQSPAQKAIKLETPDEPQPGPSTLSESPDTMEVIRESEHCVYCDKDFTEICARKKFSNILGNWCCCWCTWSIENYCLTVCTRKKVESYWCFYFKESCTFQERFNRCPACMIRRVLDVGKNLHINVKLKLNEKIPETHRKLDIIDDLNYKPKKNPSMSFYLQTDLRGRSASGSSDLSQLSPLGSPSSVIVESSPAPYRSCSPSSGQFLETSGSSAQAAASNTLQGPQLEMPSSNSLAIPSTSVIASALREPRLVELFSPSLESAILAAIEAAYSGVVPSSHMSRVPQISNNTFNSSQVLAQRTLAANAPSTSGNTPSVFRHQNFISPAANPTVMVAAPPLGATGSSPLLPQATSLSLSAPNVNLPGSPSALSHALSVIPTRLPLVHQATPTSHVALGTTPSSLASLSVSMHNVPSAAQSTLGAANALVSGPSVHQPTPAPLATASLPTSSFSMPATNIPFAAPPSVLGQPISLVHAPMIPQFAHPFSGLVTTISPAAPLPLSTPYAASPSAIGATLRLIPGHLPMVHPPTPAHSTALETSHSPPESLSTSTPKVPLALFPSVVGTAVGPSASQPRPSSSTALRTPSPIEMSLDLTCRSLASAPQPTPLSSPASPMESITAISLEEPPDLTAPLVSERPFSAASCTPLPTTSELGIARAFPSGCSSLAVEASTLGDAAGLASDSLHLESQAEAFPRPSPVTSEETLSDVEYSTALPQSSVPLAQPLPLSSSFDIL